LTRLGWEICRLRDDGTLILILILTSFFEVCGVLFCFFRTNKVFSQFSKQRSSCPFLGDWFPVPVPLPRFGNTFIPMLQLHIQLLTSTFILGTFTLAQNNGNPTIAPSTLLATAIYNSVIDVTITKTIEVPSYATGSHGAGAPGLLYDTSPMNNVASLMPSMSMNTERTSLANSTRATAATALAGSDAANRTGTAKLSATTKSVGSSVDGGVRRLWESLILGVATVAVGAVVLC
jgi:hypothetical protein